MRRKGGSVNQHTKLDEAATIPAAMARAAEYVRMSTDHQRYSTENQADAIREYAARRGLTIVKTYADHGKSGLSIAGRDALQTLLDDVRAGRADFQTILVYDVSRWGRFQDADESAYYEYVCKRAGIQVQYCAEQFDNDGSPISTIVKGVKRAMASEYSRELSTKVFAGQCRLIELGYRQGGQAGYGLRRQLIDGAGTRKGELSRGEQKSIQTDRVVLMPGPPNEVETVRWIYRTFVESRRSEREIAEALNARGIQTDMGRPWTRGTVHQVLINDKYVGDNVWNRVSMKLHGKRVQNASDMWVRRDGAFEGLVDRMLFSTAQAIIRHRSQRLADEEMLDALRRVLAKHGCLSGLIIDETEDVPSSSAFRSRFDGLLRAYQLVGYTPDRDYRFLVINRYLRTLHPDIVAKTIEGIRSAGGEVVQAPETELLTVNSEFTAAIVLARCQETPAGGLRWNIRLDTGLAPDISVAVRLAQGNRDILDYYLLPRIDPSCARLRLSTDNGFSLDAFRFETLDALFDLSARCSILDAAA
jgi:DNA invertase Pin-like site-specific DNA recombinase